MIFLKEEPLVGRASWYLVGFSALGMILLFFGEIGVTDEQYWRYQRMVEKAGGHWTHTWWKQQDRQRMPGYKFQQEQNPYLFPQTK